MVPLRRGHLQPARLLSNILLGTGLFLALFGIGTGAVHWAKTLMPDHEEIDERHQIEGTPEEQAEAVKIITDGVGESGIGRRPLIRNTLVGAIALAPLPALVLLKDTGPNPEGVLGETIWTAGTRLVTDPTGDPVRRQRPRHRQRRPHPAGRHRGVQPLPRREGQGRRPAHAPGARGARRGVPARARTTGSSPTPRSAPTWAARWPCTSRPTHHLLCPCHQTTFDVRQNCKVIFGPGKRPLPQLPIDVDDEGYLVATAGFAEPVGPSYWEREKDEKRMRAEES